MTAESVEHVVSYWVIFQTFHSPTLAGFAIISHWVPFLLFSVYAGALADRFDCRRLIQIAQGILMLVSLGWGALFLTGTLRAWHAGALLVLHGVAGVLVSPALQLIIHDIVGRDHLQSAIRLNAVSRYFCFLLGPALGGGLMLVVGPGRSLLVNVLLYLPLTLYLFRMPYTGHSGEGGGPRPMPRFANAAGAVIGALLLEGVPALQGGARAAIVCAGIWGALMALFPFVHNYGAAVTLLALGGIFNIAFTSMAQALVQVLAPTASRGRVVGLFNTSMLGLRAGSGFTVGVLGALIGVEWSLALSSLAVVVVSLGLLLSELRPSRTE